MVSKNLDQRRRTVGRGKFGRAARREQNVLDGELEKNLNGSKGEMIFGFLADVYLCSVLSLGWYFGFKVFG
ncbi:transmembrane protein, putative [Medicago truncatula]|uniref:Transmembrane protein, putative n=1 Tax=Medicago truncatula TaxID=3880 RepID=G7LAT9_MEDTR|nr:transmembrane protein, putative [Medicago truncatula]